MLPSSFADWTETTLGGVWILRGVPEETLLHLGNLAEWERRPVGDRLIAATPPPRRFFFLTSGSVRARLLSNGSTSEVGPGATIGLRNAMAKGGVGLEVKAASPVTIGWLSVEDLTAAMADCGRLAIAIAESLRVRVNSPFAIADDRQFIDHRLAAALIAAGAPHRRGDGIAVLPSLPDLSLWSTLAGLMEADLRRAFKRFERAGLIRIVAGERLHVSVKEMEARFAR
ncbi:MAG: Crp/Fnr family transcriptional regulator [Geminicoccaceae bacterium]|nr:MAG: Crp/Fnr family transcriptional regulator [Geminicoccaceae bacterium]